MVPLDQPVILDQQDQQDLLVLTLLFQVQLDQQDLLVPTLLFQVQLVQPATPVQLALPVLTPLLQVQLVQPATPVQQDLLVQIRQFRDQLDRLDLLVLHRL